jgi:hypothetical protein
MSARKLARLAGLVFVLAAAVGGFTAAGAGAQHSGETQASVSTPEVLYSTNEIIWE